MSATVAGLDLGCSADWTALAVCRAEHPDGRSELVKGRGAEPVIRLLQLNRMRDTPYPELVRRIAWAFSTEPKLKGAELVADATGVGLPVVQLLSEARLHPVCVTITGGDRESHDRRHGWRVPKRDLIMSLKVLMQQGRFKYKPTMPLVEECRKEVLAYSYKINPLTAHDSYAADTRAAPHDDLVLAICLATWRLRQLPPSEWMPWAGGQRRMVVDVGYGGTDEDEEDGDG